MVPVGATGTGERLTGTRVWPEPSTNPEPTGGRRFHRSFVRSAFRGLLSMPAMWRRPTFLRPPPGGRPASRNVNEDHAHATTNRRPRPDHRRQARRRVRVHSRRSPGRPLGGLQTRRPGTVRRPRRSRPLRGRRDPSGPSDRHPVGKSDTHSSVSHRCIRRLARSCRTSTAREGGLARGSAGRSPSRRSEFRGTSLTHRQCGGR